MEISGRQIIVVIVIILILGAGSYYYYNEFHPEEIEPPDDSGIKIEMNEREIRINHKIEDGKFLAYRNGNWEEMLVKGVNIGMGKPGYFPGEAAITKDEYTRWFDMIGDMNANAVRIYTCHPPCFYEALQDHNRNNPDPIYIFHGVWITVSNLLENMNAWDQSVVDEFIRGIKDTIDLINGNTTLEKRPGRASGEYSADISRYVMGLVLGVEWDPSLVQGTNEKNLDMPDYSGRFVSTIGGSPFENWLAYAIDRSVEYDTETYGEQRPISFVNWPTTDPMTHPEEPLYHEDLVGINQNHIVEKADLFCGLFATYHVYPYYPDFMNYQPDYVNSTGFDGRPSNYAGYLEDLVNSNEYPVIIGEFGVPTSRGIAHRSVYDMNHGYHTEREQGEILSRLFREIVDQECAGGFVFSWQDEWFKRSWNTMLFNNHTRRPYWRDIQTCEQHFGILGFYPGKDNLLLMDGSDDDWKDIDSKKFDLSDHDLVNGYEDGYDEGRTIDGIHLHADVGYLNIRVDYRDLGDGIKWEDMNALILLDTIPDQGITEMPFNTGLRTEDGVDFIIKLAGEEDSRVYVDSYYDPNHYRYSEVEERIDEKPYASVKDNGVFHRINMTLNRGFHIETLDLDVPFETHETGKLRWGNTDPESVDFDSLADFMGSAESDMVEMRIPWNLINFKDPSNKEIMGDIWEGGLESSTFIEGINIAVVTYKPDKSGNAVGEKDDLNIADSTSIPEGGIIPSEGFYHYDYPEWDIPEYHERLKLSYYHMRDTYGNID